MTHALAIRLLTSLADMLDNERALSNKHHPSSLTFSPDFALKFASAAEHAAQWLATLPEVEEEEAEE
jgi:hypothetical protein